MLLRGHITYKEKQKYNKKENKFETIDKRIIHDQFYEPVDSSDNYSELPYKNQKLKNSKCHSSIRVTNNHNPEQEEFSNDNDVYDVNKLRYSYNPFRSTYNVSYLPNRISCDTLVGNNKNLGTGVAYNSRKQKIEFLKSNIFYDRDKFNQNNYLRDNFDPKSINHNNWYTKLDWRNDKSELIFYKDNQKEFYDNNSRANRNCFGLYK